MTKKLTEPAAITEVVIEVPPGEYAPETPPGKVDWLALRQANEETWDAYQTAKHDAAYWGMKIADQVIAGRTPYDYLIERYTTAKAKVKPARETWQTACEAITIASDAAKASRARKKTDPAE